MVLRDFRKKVEDLINDSHLSVDCVYFVMKDIFKEVEEVYRFQSSKEDKQKEEAEKQKDEESK